MHCQKTWLCEDKQTTAIFKTHLLYRGSSPSIKKKIRKWSNLINTITWPNYILCCWVSVNGGWGETYSRIQSPNFWTFYEPKNWFNWINSASLCSLAGRYDSRIPSSYSVPSPHRLFKIPALYVHTLTGFSWFPTQSLRGGAVKKIQHWQGR